MLHIYLPYGKETITQKFGENANPLYASQGLKGHPAYDWGVPYGTPIPNCVANAYCYSNMHVNDPILMDYRGTFFIVEDEAGNPYEISYGHLSSFAAEVGKTYQVGDTIGYVGNTGPVFVGQHEVTEAEKDAGSHAGAHLHGPQVRVLKKVKYTNEYPNMIYDDKGPLQIDGWFFAVPDYNNGYNGCVSLAPFSTEMLAVKAAPQTPTATQVVTDALPVLAADIQQSKNLPEPQKTLIQQAIANILAILSKILGN